MEEEGVKIAQIKARMKREKRSREMGEKARNITKKKVKTPVLRALTTKDTGEQVELNRPSDMVRAITRSNIKLQQQCEGTPFMTAPLLLDFNILPLEDIENQVVNGTYEIPSGTSPYAQEFICSLEIPEII